LIKTRTADVMQGGLSVCTEKDSFWIFEAHVRSNLLHCLINVDELVFLLFLYQHRHDAFEMFPIYYMVYFEDNK